jgi:hypothetical protein
MNIERAALRGQIAVKERELREQKLKAAGFLQLLRIELSPYVDIGTLNEEKIEAYSAQLCESILITKAIIQKLGEMEAQLNG